MSGPRNVRRREGLTGDASPAQRVIAAMMGAYDEHPEHEGIAVIILGGDPRGGDGVVQTDTNLTDEGMTLLMLSCLQAVLKGSGTTAAIVPDRPQG